MNIFEKINEDLKLSMKAQDAVKLGTLRMLKAAITNKAISQKKDQLDEPEILDVIDKQAKQRKESYDCFIKAGRNDLAEKEKVELEILSQYLPLQLTETELIAIIKAAIAKTGAAAPSDMGKIMKEIMPAVKGRSDGKAVNTLVQKLLQPS